MPAHDIVLRGQGWTKNITPSDPPKKMTGKNKERYPGFVAAAMTALTAWEGHWFLLDTAAEQHQLSNMQQALRKAGAEATVRLHPDGGVGLWAMVADG